MTKPLCAICYTRHHDYQGHVFASNKEKVVANAVVNAVANTKKRSPGKYKDAEARKSYMADYMRKRRAAKAQ